MDRFVIAGHDFPADIIPPQVLYKRTAREREKLGLFG